MTPGLNEPGRRAFIDMLRALAILQVVWFHVVHGFVRFASPEALPVFIDAYPAILNVAWHTFGVDIIFFVSAFLLAYRLFEEQRDTGGISFRTYFIRRVSRILPMYYLALVIYALAQGSSWTDTLWSALFVGYLVSNSNVIPVGWTMEAIILVYVALPFVVTLLGRISRPGLLLFLALLVALAARLAYMLTSGEDFSSLYATLLETRQPVPVFFEIYFRLWFRIAPFIVGLAAAWIMVARPGIASAMTTTGARRVGVWIVGLGLLVPINWLPVTDTDSVIYSLGAAFWTAFWAFGPTLVSLGACALIFAWFGAERPRRNVPGARFWSLVSGNIFAVYLFHMPLIAVAAMIVFRSTDKSALDAATPFHMLAVSILATILTLLVAWPVTRYIEKPQQAVLRRLIP